MISKIALVVAGLALAPSVAEADAIINLAAGPASANAGPAVPGYGYNPVQMALGAGSYSVSVVGVAGGGAYDAWTINAPAGPGSYTDGYHFTLLDGQVFNEVTGVNYDSSAAALAAYSALPPAIFTLPHPETVAFYLNDLGFPYFADDSGGVSLRLTEQVPEPGSLVLVGTAIVIVVWLAWLRRRRGQA